MKNFKRMILCTSIAICILGTVSVPFIISSSSEVTTNDVSVIKTSDNDENSQNLITVPVSEKKTELTKDDVFYMMLNAQFNYDKISGKIVNGQTMDMPMCVDFSVDLADGGNYSKVTVNPVVLNESYSENLSADTDIIDEYKTDDCKKYEEHFIDKNGQAINFNNLDRTKYVEKMFDSYDRDDVIKIDNEERITEIEGEKCYCYVSNPMITGYESICINPQEMAFGFLEDQSLWEITGETEYIGRKCLVIEGNTEQDYGSKLNVDKFSFLVDYETGILLKYTGFDIDGNLSDYMYAEEISFDYNKEMVKSLLAEKINLDYSEVQS